MVHELTIAARFLTQQTAAQLQLARDTDDDRMFLLHVLSEPTGTDERVVEDAVYVHLTFLLSMFPAGMFPSTGPGPALSTESLSCLTAVLVRLLIVGSSRAQQLVRNGLLCRSRLFCAIDGAVTRPMLDCTCVYASLLHTFLCFVRVAVVCAVV